ncbi:U6 snRNA phosphodiesterase-like isoform X2 [Homarus americanus]|uniref:U6 snRNA phosphodiesterase-like isoform X2 n=1 Tax=Homarus americanus TaxID=6706 RepID=UPI001C4465CF|nr:U6 snRNA phosphodiesterase-like isoform X2 [Homarus americanus]
MATGGRGALSLLQSYGSDSDGDSGYTSEDEKKRKHVFSSPLERKRKRRRADDEEEMAVDTPSSSSRPGYHQDSVVSSETVMGDGHQRPSDHTMDTTSHQLNSNRIPLPSELLLTREIHVDDSREHQGRVRSFPHERGNWASILYVPLHLGVYGASFASFMASLVAMCQEQNVILTPSSDLHISLTRTLILQLHWIQPLTEDLRARLSQVSKFSLWLHGLSVYANDERTRTFLGLRVCHGRNELEDIVSEVDKCLAEYRLPLFYKDGSYHVSVAWCTGDVSENLRRLLPQLENICSQYFSVETDMRTFDVNLLNFKTGNRIHNIHLKHEN